MSKKQKLVLFLGGADREGATEQLHAAGTKYKRKMLESSIGNWKKILKLFDQHEVSSVVVKLTNTAFKMLCRPSYEEVREELLELISERPNIFLAHESLITGVRFRDPDFDEITNTPEKGDAQLDDYTLDDFLFDRFKPPEEWERIKVEKILAEKGINLIPYKKNIELGLLASSFIEQHENHLIFRMYVPSERMWAREAEKLLQLFRDYLHKVSNLEVKQEQYKTNQGIVYEFFGEDKLTASQLSEEFDEFSTFMETCATDPGKASLFLESKNLARSEVISLVEQYSKESRRLHIDIKQERESKLLTIRHRLESELAEYARTHDDWEVVNRIVDSVVPRVNGITDALNASPKPTTDADNQSLTININPQIIDSIHGVVARQISGNQHLGADATQLLEMIEKHAGDQQAELKSALYEITDKGVKESDRVVAGQRLKGFLLSAKSRVGGIAAGVLQSYIERQLGL